MLLYNPTLVVILNEETKKFHPAILSEMTTTSMPITNKFAPLSKNVLYTYLIDGFNTMKEAVCEIEDTLKSEIGARTCVSTHLRWSGNGHPNMFVHIEEDQHGKLHITS